MLKGDGQKMVTGRFSQGQFHVVSEAEFGIGIWQDAQGNRRESSYSLNPEGGLISDRSYIPKQRAERHGAKVLAN